MSRREKLIEFYGSEEELSRVMKERGAKARRDTPRGFARMDTNLVRMIARKGGMTKKKKK